MKVAKKSSMVNRPDSSSTRSDKSSSGSSKSMSKTHNYYNKNSGSSGKSVFIRSKSGNDYSDKMTQGKMRNSSSLQSITKSGDKGTRGLRKFKSNSRY